MVGLLVVVVGCVDSTTVLSISLNDSLDDALHLSKLLKGILCHVNLIPVNKIKDGIKEEDIPYLFDRFFRSENVRGKIN